MIIINTLLEMERGSTDLSGHFGPSSSHMSLSIIQPSPGKKSVLYSFSATCQATVSKQHVSVTQPSPGKKAVLYSLSATWQATDSQQHVSVTQPSPGKKVCSVQLLCNMAGNRQSATCLCHTAQGKSLFYTASLQHARQQAVSNTLLSHSPGQINSLSCTGASL